MTTLQLLQIMRVLSAMESAMFASKTTIPDYLLEHLNLAVESLENEIINRTKEST